MSYLKLALKVKTNPVDRQITRRVHRQSAEETMYAITLSTLRRIAQSLRGTPYKATDAILHAEDHVNATWREVLAGNGSITDYQGTCERWFAISVKPHGHLTN